MLYRVTFLLFYFLSRPTFFLCNIFVSGVMANSNNPHIHKQRTNLAFLCAVGSVTWPVMSISFLVFCVCECELCAYPYSIIHLDGYGV